VPQNKAIRRRHYPTRTIEELIYDMNGAKIFSKLDIIKAFQQWRMLKDTSLPSPRMRDSSVHKAAHGHLLRNGVVHGGY